MALVSAGFELSVSAVDNGGGVVTKIFQLVAATAAAAATDALALIGDYNGVTDLVISGYSIKEMFVEDALVLPTSLNAQKENVARLSLQLASNPTKKVTYEIPAPIEAMFVGAAGSGENYNVVNTSYALLTTFTENFEAVGGTATISDGEFLAATNNVVKGRRVHKKTNFSSPG